MAADAAIWLRDNAAAWDAAAGRWRALGPVDGGKAALLAEQLGCRAGALLLDAGCGAGRWAVPLAEAGYRVRGIDLATAMVEATAAAAGEHGLDSDRLQTRVGDVARLPFPKATFDGAVCIAVLDFAPSPCAVLTELWRVLKPGRRLVLATLGAYSPVKWEAWHRFLPDATPGMRINGILPWETEALLAELGWQVVAQRAGFERTAAGRVNPYAGPRGECLTERVLQQTVATSWWLVALKSEASREALEGGDR